MSAEDLDVFAERRDVLRRYQADTNEPLKETRNRKPLRPNPVAPWELRVRELRVFYEVGGGPPSVVRILAVGVKTREVLRIGGEEITL